MKVKIELSSSELHDHVRSYLKEQHGEVSTVNCEFGTFDLDDFKKFYEKNYDKSSNILRNMSPKLFYFAIELNRMKQLEQKELDPIVSSFVENKFNVKVVSINYSMVLHNYYQIDSALKYGGRIDGSLIAECEVEEKPKKVMLNFI